MPSTFTISASFIDGYFSNVVASVKAVYQIENSPDQNLISGIENEVIKNLEDLLQLTFVKDKLENSTVCLANSMEVRDDFRTVFDLNDLQAYCLAVLHHPTNPTNYIYWKELAALELLYPNSYRVFWTLVRLGNRLKQTPEPFSITRKGILKEIATIDLGEIL